MCNTNPNPAKIGSMQVRLFRFAAIAFLIFPASAVTLTTSPDGPLKTPGAARDIVRELRRGGGKSPMSVTVRAGTYFLDEAANFDFRLTPGSPALKLGFQQIDMTTVVPRGVAGPAGREK